MSGAGPANPGPSPQLERLDHATREALRLTEAMLQACRAHQWDELIALMAQRAPLLGILQEQPWQPESWPAALRDDFRQRVTALLQANQQAAELTTIWHAELGGMLQSTLQEQRLAKAYGPR